MAAGDPRKEHAGAGFGQGSARKRWNAFLEFLLKYQQQIGRGQAPEPPAVGRFMRNHIELENYLTEEIYILKMKESALNLIININFEITRISEEIEKSKDEFANKKGFKNELAIRGQREYISELETSLLLVQYLSRIHNGNKENIKYALFVRRNKYVARREAFIYARRNHYDLNKIKSKMDDKMKSLEILFPKIEYPNQELMGPIIFGKEYAFSLREILMLIKFYKTAMSKIN